MKNIDILNFFDFLQSVDTNKASNRFKYFIAKNKTLFENEVKLLYDTLKSSEQYNEFEKKRLEICDKYCKKDENNKLIIENNSFIVKEEFQEISNSEIRKLEEENKEILDLEIKRIEDLNKILEEESNIQAYNLIGFEDLPESISQKNMDFLVKIEVIK